MPIAHVTCAGVVADAPARPMSPRPVAGEVPDVVEPAPSPAGRLGL